MSLLKAAAARLAGYVPAVELQQAQDRIANLERQLASAKREGRRQAEHAGSIKRRDDNQAVTAWKRQWKGHLAKLRGDAFDLAKQLQRLADKKANEVTQEDLDLIADASERFTVMGTDEGGPAAPELYHDAKVEGGQMVQGMMNELIERRFMSPIARKDTKFSEGYATALRDITKDLREMEF